MPRRKKQSQVCAEVCVGACALFSVFLLTAAAYAVARLAGV
jgi:hypothetical protein